MRQKTGYKFRLYYPDHLSFVSFVTDKRATIVQSFAYMPYGELLVEDSSVDLDYRFSAKETDRETGLSYFGARYYDPTAAMWLGTDPLWEKYVGMNPYNYCAGNPVGMIDVDGRAIYGHKNDDGSTSYAVVENKVDKNGNIDNPQVYKNEYGEYQLIDNSYDLQTEDGEWKQVPKQVSYDQVAGYALYGGISTDEQRTEAQYIYNSIDVSEFPGASFAKKRNEFSIKNAYNLFVWISCLIGDVETSLDEARKLQNHFNLQETEAETQQSTPEIQIKKEKILKKRVVDSSGFWYKYATDTMIIITNEEKDVIKIDTVIKKQK